VEGERPDGEEPLSGGWLPPEPPGPAPELGEPAPPPVEEPVTSGGWAPPQGAAPGPPRQPGAAQEPVPPAAASTPATASWQEPGQPSNNNAVSGFVLSLSSIAVLLLSGGVAWPLTLGCAIVAIVYARRGKEAIKAGHVARHDQLAQAGFVIAIVAAVLSVLAIAGCAAIVADHDFRDNFKDRDNSPGGGFDSVVTLVRLLRL
jgi:hypothetical protein